MKSALQQYKEMLTPGAVFTVSWPSPMTIHGNTGTTVLTSPDDLRTVERVTSSKVYFKRGKDGATTSSDFPKAALIERRDDGSFVFYDPKSGRDAAGVWSESPNERGRLNYVYTPGDCRKDVTQQFDAADLPSVSSPSQAKAK